MIITKRIVLSYLIIVLCVCCCCNSLADTTSITFGSNTLDSFDLSVKDWTGSNYAGAVFTVVSMMDLVSNTSFSSEDFDLTYGAIVLSSYEFIVQALIYHKLFGIVMISYTPLLKSANYAYLSFGDQIDRSTFRDDLLGLFKTQTSIDSARYITLGDLMDVVQTLK